MTGRGRHARLRFPMPPADKDSPNIAATVWIARAGNDRTIPSATSTSFRPCASNMPPSRPRSARSLRLDLPNSVQSQTRCWLTRTHFGYVRSCLSNVHRPVSERRATPGPQSRRRSARRNDHLLTILGRDRNVRLSLCLVQRMYLALSFPRAALSSTHSSLTGPLRASPGRLRRTFLPLGRDCLS
jgi:hypothetical protein